MPKYLSGRAKRVPQDQLTDDRYKYLGLDQAEPNLSDPIIGPSVPSGSQYQLVAVPGFPGKRYWVPVGGGLVPGAITIFDEGTIVSASSSITQLNFVGAAVTANVSVQSPSGFPGIAATITVNPVSITDNPPTGARSGELWWESDTGDLYVYYEDGDSAQWVTTNTGGAGPAGDKGQKGDTGQKGQTGLSGNVGAKGEKGEKGQKGEVEAQGNKGQKGETGVGQKGQKGEAGSNGNDGQKGESGTKGQKGELGVGQKGEKGQKGADGGGATVTISDNAPGSPSAGDMWWDSDDFDLHVYYGDGDSNQWVSITSNAALKGQKGEKGEKGEKGQKGEIGEKGQKGEVGLSGNAGGKGEKGQKGEVGAQGTGGSAGTKGQKGEAGAAASKGDKGQKGEDNSTKGQKGESAAAAISNNADNRLITGSNTAGQLNGEANLTFDGSQLRLPDNIELGIGNNGTYGDLRIFHNSSESIIWDNGTGGLVLQTASSPIELRAIGQPSNEIMLKANVGGSVDLYEDGTLRFETTTSGAKVSGDLEVTGNINGTLTSLPSGTRMLFQQSSAPAGWTKDTSLNNRALRLVSGTVGNGGSTSFADAFNANRVTSGGTVSNHTLTTAQLPAHFHNVWTRNETAIDGSRGNSNANTADHYWYSAGSGYRQVHIGGNHYAPTSSNTGGGQSHNHGFTNPSFNLNVLYTDVIIAQKN